MAQMKNVFTTGQAVGNREDLADLIVNISKDDTPFLSMIGRGKAKAKRHDWQTDKLREATENRNVEGKEAEAKKTEPTKRCENATQIFTEEFSVSGTQEAVDKAGRKSEIKYQTVKKRKEINRDIELAFLGKNKMIYGDDDTIARQSRGFFNWIETNYNGGIGFAPGGKDTDIVAGTKRAFTEDLLKDVIQKAYTAGGDPNVIMTAPSKKAILSDTFLGVGAKTTQHILASKGTAGYSLEIYQSEFGLLTVVPNRHMVNSKPALNLEDCVAVFDPKMWEKATLRPSQVKKLGTKGDGDEFMIVEEATLVSKNEASSGAIFDLD